MDKNTCNLNFNNQDNEPIYKLTCVRCRTLFACKVLVLKNRDNEIGLYCKLPGSSKISCTIVQQTGTRTKMH